MRRGVSGHLVLFQQRELLHGDLRDVICRGATHVGGTRRWVPADVSRVATTRMRRRDSSLKSSIADHTVTPGVLKKMLRPLVLFLAATFVVDVT
jgi:hypothetical protein